MMGTAMTAVAVVAVALAYWAWELHHVSYYGF